MKQSFKATCVHAEDMGDYLLVGFADDKYETVDYLTFQRSHESDEQDVALGMDTVHVERNDQAHSDYGGMRCVILFPNLLRVEFDESGMEFMDGLDHTEVEFDLPLERFEALRSALKRCFAKLDFYYDYSEGIP